VTKAGLGGGSKMHEPRKQLNAQTKLNRRRENEKKHPQLEVDGIWSDFVSDHKISLIGLPA
jgi:hypothetical protein